MTAPAFKAIGARVVGSGSATATSPTLAAGDVCLGFVRAGSNPTTPSGWTVCAGCPVSDGNDFYNVYWQRASADGIVTLPITASGSGNVFAIIAAYSGCVATGDPTEAGGGKVNAASTTINIPAITTLGPDRLVVLSGYAPAVRASPISNATLSGLATRDSFEPQIGDGSLASDGSSGASSFTVGSSVVSATHAIALIPVSGVTPNTAAVNSSIGALASTVAATATLAVVASCGMGALSCGVTVTQANTAQSASSIGPLTTAITFQQININTAAITATLGALGSPASVAQGNAAQGVALLPALTTEATASAGNAAQASVTLPRFESSLQVSGAQFAQATTVLAAFGINASASAANQAAITATLPDLSTAITVTLHTGYLPDGQFYVRLAARSFYASLPARSFYAATPARSFYAKSNPDMTKILSTKDPREERMITLDATGDLEVGETLVAITKTEVAMFKGADQAPSNILAGDALINPAQLVVDKVPDVPGNTVTIAPKCGVQVPVADGLDARWYLLAVTCTTTNPEKTVTLKAILPISAK